MSKKKSPSQGEVKQNSTESSKIYCEDKFIRDGLFQYIRAGRFTSNRLLETLTKIMTASPFAITYMDETDDKIAVDIKPDYWACFSKHNKSDDEPITSSKQLLHKESRIILSSQKNKGKNLLAFNIDNIYADCIQQELKSYITRLNSTSQYGAFSEMRHKSFLLAPILTKNSDNPIGAIAEITLFENGLFCLTVSTYIHNMSVDELCNNLNSITIGDVLLPLCIESEHRESWGYYDTNSCYSVCEIAELWLNAIKMLIKGHMELSKESHKLLYLFSFDGMPDNFENENASDSYQWFIYRLLQAPINDFNIRPPEIRQQLYLSSRYRMTTHLEVYSATIYRTIVVAGRDWSTLVKQLLERSGEENPDEDMMHVILHDSIISAILPAAQIEMLSVCELELISKSCRDIDKKSPKSLLSIRKEAYDATLLYYDSHRVQYDSLRELADFLSDRHSHTTAVAHHEKIIDQFDKAIQFRDQLSSEKRSHWLNIILTIFTLVESLGQVITVLIAINAEKDVFHSNPSNKSLLLIAIAIWGCLICFAIIGLIILNMKKRKFK